MNKTSVWCVSALALLGCTTEPPTIITTTDAPAPEIGKADGATADTSDADCQIVLQTVGRVANATGGYETDCSTGPCWYVFRGSIDVTSAALAAAGTTVGVMYNANNGASWDEVAATEDTSAQSGDLHHFTFEFFRDTAEDGESTTGLSALSIAVVPLLHLSTGARVFDHNRNADPFANYVLDLANSWSIGADASVCAPGSDPDHDCRVVLRSITNNVTTEGSDGSIVWDGTLDVRSDVVAALSGAPQVGYETTVDNIWSTALATAAATSPIAGFQRYTFALDHNTVRSGEVDGYLWDQMVIQLIPSVQVGDIEWFDHNFANTASASNPDANYILTQALNDTQYSAPSSVCPAR